MGFMSLSLVEEVGVGLWTLGLGVEVTIVKAASNECGAVYKH